MKCLVCGKVYSGNMCPICDFPVVNITTNDEEGLKALQPTIEAHRAAFSKKVALSLLAYTYDVDDSSVTFQSNDKIPFGSVSHLCDQSIWLDTEFTNVKQRKTIPVTLCVDIQNKPVYQVTVNVKNLPSDMIQVGIAVDRSLQFNFLLKDSSGQSICSEIQPIII